MIKYVQSMVTFEEIPTEVTLSLSISNCQNRCSGCHSPELSGNIGTELTNEVLDELIKKNNGISCVLLLGEGSDRSRLIDIANHVRNEHKLAVALYSGRDNVEEDIWEAFDYVKIGRYVASLGPLNKVTTNQRLYKSRKDITNLFWK